MTWDLFTNSRSPLRTPGFVMKGVAFSPDGQKMVEKARLGRDVTVRLVSDDSVLTVITNSLAWCPAAAFSPDGACLACGWTDQSLRIYDTKSWQQMAVLRGHLDEISAIAFSADSKMIFTGAKDGAVKAWLNQPAKATSEPVHWIKNTPFFTHVSREGLTALSDVDSQGRRQTWSTLSQEMISGDVFAGKSNFVFDAATPEAPHAWSAKFEKFVGRSLAGNLSVAKLHSSAADVELESSSNPYLELVFSKDTQLIAGLSASDEAVLWVAATGQIRARHKLPGGMGENSRIYSLTDQGALAGSTGLDGFVWDSRTPEAPILLLPHRLQVTHLAFSPDGRTVASSGYDALIKCWDARTGVLLATLEGDPSAFQSVSFSPDGSRIVGSGYGGGVYIWDAHDFRFLAVLKGHQFRVLSAYFTPDNFHLVSSDGREIIIWTADPPEAPR